MLRPVLIGLSSLGVIGLVIYGYLSWDGFPSTAKHKSEIQALENEIAAHKQKITELETKTNAQRLDIAKRDETITNLRQIITNKDAEIAELKAIKLATQTEIRDDFDDIRTFLDDYYRISNKADASVAGYFNDPVIIGRKSMPIKEFELRRANQAYQYPNRRSSYDKNSLSINYNPQTGRYLLRYNQLTTSTKRRSYRDRWSIEAEIVKAATGYKFVEVRSFRR